MCCHPCWDITATPQPLQAHSQAPTSHGFLAPIALLSYHFTFYYCTSSLFPLPYTLLCSFMNSSNVQYSHIQKTITNTHTYMHTTEFTHCLHTSAILFHGTWWMLIAPAIIPTFSAVSPAHHSFKLFQGMCMLPPKMGQLFSHGYFKQQKQSVTQHCLLGSRRP